MYNKLEGHFKVTIFVMKSSTYYTVDYCIAGKSLYFMLLHAWLYTPCKAFPLSDLIMLASYVVQFFWCYVCV